MKFHHTTLAVALFSLLSLGCASSYREVGPYRIVVATDGFGGLFCQPRTDLYFVNPSSKPAKPTYLGTCGTPLFVTKQLHMPSDPSCIAFSEDGSALVYYHHSQWCGAGKRAAQKPSGVYLHSMKEGDRFLYSDPEQVNQSWGGDNIGNHSIRVQWVGKTPSKGGATSVQYLVIDASGKEHPEGSPDQSHPSYRK